LAVITIRLLNVDDVAAYERLRLEALQDSPAAFGSSYEEEVKRPTSQIISRLRDSTIFGAHPEEGPLIGLLGFRREVRTKRAHNGELFGMHVSRPFRRQGVGGALLDHVIQYARDLGGIRTIKLSVTANNGAAVQLYRSRGFKSFGLEPDALAIDGAYLAEEYMILFVE
jgi:ribosomal protein S18 acetylase RimI-like enzyme